MGRRILVSLALLLCVEAAQAQVATTSTTSTSTSTIDTSHPVAWLYVASKHYIHAYKVWVNGNLTSITGSLPCRRAGDIRAPVI